MYCLKLNAKILLFCYIQVFCSENLFFLRKKYFKMRILKTRNNGQVVSRNDELYCCLSSKLIVYTDVIILRTK